MCTYKYVDIVARWILYAKINTYRWYRKFQFKKKLRIQANALAAQKANKLHRGGTKSALLKMQSSSQLLPSQRNPTASDALTSSAMRLSPLEENVSFRRDSKK